MVVLMGGAVGVKAIERSWRRAKGARSESHLENWIQNKIASQG
jgi:hypothetical protein